VHLDLVSDEVKILRLLRGSPRGSCTFRVGLQHKDPLLLVCSVSAVTCYFTRLDIYSAIKTDFSFSFANILYPESTAENLYLYYSLHGSNHLPFLLVIVVTLVDTYETSSKFVMILELYALIPSVPLNLLSVLTLIPSSFKASWVGNYSIRLYPRDFTANQMRRILSVRFWKASLTATIEASFIAI
jgi:hypothetical protein